jgi:hypothetical protein
MSEDKKSPSIIIKGGTTSSSFDEEVQRFKKDAESRREVDEKEKKLGQIPIDKGGALLFERRMEDKLTSPRVLLNYVGWGREVIEQQLCELILDDTVIPNQHVLVFVCPECVRRGIPMELAQLHVRDSHRAWHIDTRGAGEVKAVSDSSVEGGIEFYTHAGSIDDTEDLACSGFNCGSVYRISKNNLRRVR